MIRKDNMSNTVLEKLKQSLLKLILSFQLYHSDERLYVFTLRAFVLGLISSFRLDFRKGIQSVISTWSILHLGLLKSVFLTVEGNNKGLKTNTQRDVVHQMY